MIEIYDRVLKRMVRCEGARVYIPGFEYADVYATPFYDADGAFADGKWVITEARSGFRFDGAWPTIDEAVTEAMKELVRLHMTRERFELAVSRALAESKQAA